MRAKTISVNIPEQVDRAYQKLAEEEMTSKSAVIRRVLANHVRSKEGELQFARRQEKQKEGK